MRNFKKSEVWSMIPQRLFTTDLGRKRFIVKALIHGFDQEIMWHSRKGNGMTTSHAGFCSSTAGQLFFSEFGKDGQNKDPMCRNLTPNIEKWGPNQCPVRGHCFPVLAMSGLPCSIPAISVAACSSGDPAVLSHVLKQHTPAMQP